MDFSVLMTTYNGESCEFLDASLNSLLVDQTVIPNDLVLVVDGPIRDELDEVIKSYKKRFKDILNVIYCEKNQGQSKASAEGMKHIKNEIIARMDSDDICCRDRFEKELAVLAKDPSVSVVGGWIEEFDQEPGDSKRVREVPELDQDIKKHFYKRNPVNNVTSMIKKQAIIDAGGYGNDTINEDYSLFARMWVNGCTFYNIPEVLVNVRVGNGMVDRRQSIAIYKDWKHDQFYLYHNKKQSLLKTLYSCLLCYMFVKTPRRLKNFLYKKVLRKKNK